MCVPAGFTEYVFTLHYVITADDVFNTSCYNMTDMRSTVCCRRAVIECPFRAVFSLSKCFLKDVVIFPEF